MGTTDAYFEATCWCEGDNPVFEAEPVEGSIWTHHY